MSERSFSDLSGVQSAALHGSGCDVRMDRLTRCLYALDASIYRVQPAAVAFPRSALEAAKVLRAAAENGVEVTPRGAGTGLAGGAIGSGLIVDDVGNVNDVAAIVASVLEPATPDPADCKLALALSDAINTGDALIDD